MTDVGFRDFGSFAPDGRRQDILREPSVAPVSPQPSSGQADVLITPPPAASMPRAIFGGERTDGRDALGIDETLVHLAELAVHKSTEGPMSIGLLGGPGRGKTFALGRLTMRIRDLAAAAGRAPEGPFLSRVHVQSIDAAGLEGDPAFAIAARLHAGLRQPYPDLAREIGAVARDPHVTLRDANEKLDETRRRLDLERRALDDAGARRARLTETVLYEAAGSQVDAYARANRAGLESRLTGFGLTGDPIQTYKGLVQRVAGSGGPPALALRSFWAFKGQTKLIILALVLIGVGVGLGRAITDQSVWLGDLRASPKAGAQIADWIEAHIDLFATAQTVAFGLAALALIGNIFRAINFIRPVLTGARLLENDLDTRRHDIDGLYAHQTKRVDALDGDVERLTRAVADAERRAGGNVSSEASPFETTSEAAQAQTIFAALGRLMTRSELSTPQRIVLSLDNVDALSPKRARALLNVLHRVAGPGITAVIAFDPVRLDTKGSQRNELERWIQVPLRLDAAIPADAKAAIVRDALGGQVQSDRGIKPVTSDVRRSDLDAPISDEEASMLAALTSLAGATPRDMRRLAGLYLLARLGEERPLGILAFMLALMQGGTAQERALVAASLAGDAMAPFDIPQSERRLRDAFTAAIESGGRVTRGDASDAARRAALFSLNPLTIPA